MTKGRLVPVERRKLFINKLQDNSGNLTNTLQQLDMAHQTYKGLRQRDPAFARACDAIQESKLQEIKDEAYDALKDNLQDRKEITTIYANKAFNKHNETTEIQHTGDNDNQFGVPIRALSKSTLEAIKQDINEYKEKRNIPDTDDAEDIPYEEIEYDGEKIEGGLDIYDPATPEPKRASPGEGVKVD